ncbi:hypothetical protein, partial [Escherichia coli]|uniref:hypothetical protein n=1 Tax=Escherichia coli TaxID=562 RepID=UPI001BC84CA5
ISATAYRGFRSSARQTALASTASTPKLSGSESPLLPVTLAASVTSSPAAIAAIIWELHLCEPSVSLARPRAC